VKVTPLFLLTLTFVILRLIDKIDWSWWWVLSPLWIVFLIAILVGVIQQIGESK
jgi:hypothetical protein